MLLDSVLGLAVAVVVISSVAWVSQFRKIKARIKAKKAARVHQETQETRKAA